MAIRPEDILKDNENTTVAGGVTVRKGSIAASFANAEILSSPKASEEEKASARAMLKELAPGLIGLKMHEHVTWKNPEIQQIIDNALAKSS
jgi:hypothetical protein